MQKSVNYTTAAGGKLTHVATSDETPAEGSVRDNLYIKVPGSLQKSDGFILNVQGEWRIFDLDGRYRMDCVCPAKGRSRDLAESDVFDLSNSATGESVLSITEGNHHSLDELCHRGNSVFNRDRGVSTVGVIEVHVIGP